MQQISQTMSKLSLDRSEYLTESEHSSLIELIERNNSEVSATFIRI